MKKKKKRKESGAEPDDIHQKMYEIATKNWNTVSESQGASENFQEGDLVVGHLVQVWGNSNESRLALQ